MTPEPRPEGHRAITRVNEGWKEHSNRGNSSEVKKKKSPCIHVSYLLYLTIKSYFFLKLQSKAPLPPPHPPKKAMGIILKVVFLSRRVT